MLAIVIQRNNHQRLDDRPRIILTDYHDPSWANGYEIGMWDWQRPPVSQSNRKRSKRLPMQRIANALNIHASKVSLSSRNDNCHFLQKRSSKLLKLVAEPAEQTT